jgi:hypothetical protein
VAMVKELYLFKYDTFWRNVEIVGINEMLSTTKVVSNPTVWKFQTFRASQNMRKQENKSNGNQKDSKQTLMFHFKV